ncbi:beta-ketoacyl-[acyl-carrier-protein] synthase family protein [Flavobacterium sp. JP2137]|uniref:beta-ketoacyl-[acyl-carrier-protein] synthase family protein n=1 Tax=Flavobacterium sp. JP2137 TaxID=3414510 RepID=UPI003D2FFD3E
MKKVYINQANCISPLGFGLEANWTAIQEGKTGIARVPQLGSIEQFYAARIDDDQLNWAHRAWNQSKADDSRLEKMLFLALDPLVRTNGVGSDTALIISTTKGNIGFLKTADPTQADLNLLAAKIGERYGFKTQPIIVCNACVSGVMALSVAKRLLQMELFASAYVVAADEISEFVVSGFASFQAISATPCKPYDKDRSGVSLGEAAAAVYIATEPAAHAIQILGDASIGDANHISGPSRTGEGLYQSIERALAEAQCAGTAIDMISAHGTATLFNDEMEAIAFNRLGMQHIPLHSLKGYYGHTLGASGLLEVVVAMEAMHRSRQLCCKGFEEIGTSVALNIATQAVQQPINRVLKTASGFGGTNSAIVLEKAY